MRFPYSSLIAADPASGDFLVFRRPEIPVTIIGPAGWVTYIGLVDTGSDNTIFPKSVADYLRIRLEPASVGAATAFGGNRVEFQAGDVELRVAVDGESVRWPTPVCFFDFPTQEDETVILGHSGFLDYFLASFDGKLGVLTLVANDELPASS